MNEYQATIQYMKTLRQFYNERGLIGVVKPEMATDLISLPLELEKLGTYTVWLFDVGGDPVGFEQLREENSEFDRIRRKAILNPTLGQFDIGKVARTIGRDISQGIRYLLSC